MLLQALLIANGVLLFFVIVTAVTRFWSANKDRYHKEMNIDENALKDDSNEIVSEETKEAVSATPQNIEETVKEEIDNKVETVVLVEETIKPITEEPKTETVEEELIIGDVDAPVQEGGFASKLLSLESLAEKRCSRSFMIFFNVSLRSLSFKMRLLKVKRAFKISSNVSPYFGSLGMSFNVWVLVSLSMLFT